MKNEDMNKARRNNNKYIRHKNDKRLNNTNYRRTKK